MNTNITKLFLIKRLRAHRVLRGFVRKGCRETELML